MPSRLSLNPQTKQSTTPTLSFSIEAQLRLSGSFWNERLSKFSPIAILDLYEGLTRLPEYRKRFVGLNPKAQVALMYRTLLTQKHG